MAKPRGKNFEQMGEKQKVKVEKTVERMTEIRVKDTVRLRTNIKEKLEWAKKEQKKGLIAIENSQKSIQINTAELLKLKGIILVLSQLLSESKEKEEEKIKKE